MIRSRGHCNTMGTASTMALLAEALGAVLPGTAGIPAPDSRLLTRSHQTGRLIVEMVGAGRRPSSVLRPESFHNAIVALAAIGGSTNAVVHLLAIAGRLGVPLTLADFDRIGADVPLLVDLQPAGRYLMEDLHRAGGLAAVLREVVDLLDPDAIDVTGRPFVESLADARIWDPDVIRTRDNPVRSKAGIAVLHGNLAPSGAIIKPAAASAHLLRHRGRAVVFDSVEDLHARIDSPDLDVDADSVLVLRGCGPRGYPGMPEVANMPLPTRLLRQGVRDMVRICDGRMSGTRTAPSCCTCHPRRRPVDPSTGCVPVTGSSSTCRTGRCRWTYPGRSSTCDRRRRPWSRRSPGRAGAGRSSTSTPCSAPRSARISLSSSVGAATGSRASPTDPAPEAGPGGG